MAKPTKPPKPPKPPKPGKMATLVSKTIKTSGGDYASLQALAADPQNLVAADNYWEVTCDNFEDADGTLPDFTGWTTSATCYLKIKAAGAHGSVGAITTNAYRRTVGAATATECVRVRDNGTNGLVIFEGIQFKNAYASKAAIDPLGAVSTNKTTIRFIDCIIYTAYAGTKSNSANDQNLEFVNCVFISSASIGLYGGYNTVKAYFCTIVGSSYGIYWDNAGSASGSVFKNCYAHAGTETLYIGAGATIAGMGVSDTDSQAAVKSVAYSTTNFTSVTAGSENLSLKTGSVLKYAGANVSGDGQPYARATDIGGESRGLVSPSIGADDYPAPPSTRVAATRSFMGLVLGR